MKKNILLFAFLFSLVVIGCKKEDEEVITTAVITVKENNSIKSGVSVYMFKNNLGPTTAFFKPIHSTKTVITENNGSASFDLRETFDLEINDKQTTLYFGVFDANDNVLGYTAATIEPGQTVSKTLAY